MFVAAALLGRTGQPQITRIGRIFTDQDCEWNEFRFEAQDQSDL